MACRLVDGVWQLDGGLVAPLASNVFVVDDDDAVSLLDAGLFVNYPPLRSELADAGYEPGDLDQVLVTHYDLDHVGGLRALDGFDGPVYMGADDIRLVRGEWNPQWFHHKGNFHRFARRLFPMTDVDLRAVADGEEVGNFRAYHTPGHNPGHIVYVHEDLGAAFLGDLVWEEQGELTPPFWLDSYDMHEVRESIRRLNARTPPFDAACVAHGDPIVPGGDAALDRLAARL